MRPRREAESFQKMGHSVHVVAMMDRGEPREEVVNGVRVHRFPFQIVRGGKIRYMFQYLVFLFAASVMLFRLQIRHRFKIVHVHSLPDFQVLCALPARLLGAKVILDLHEAMPELFASRFGYDLAQVPVRIVGGFELTSCAFAHRLIVVNEMMQRRLVGKGVDENKVVVVMNSPPIAETAPSVHRALDDPGSRLSTEIVYVGGVNRERDLTTLVKAVSILQSTHDVKLTIIGHGNDEYRTELRELARRSGLRSLVVKGRVSFREAFGHIASSAIGPITYERNYLTDITMPTKALEYSAAGKPLVVADLRGIREIYGNAALYYEPGDATDLARKIGTILDDPVRARQLVDGGLGVLDACSWKLMENRLNDAYSLLAREKIENASKGAEIHP